MARGKAVATGDARGELHHHFKRTYTRTLLGADDATHFSVNQFYIEPGGEIPLHIHKRHQETVYILSGRAEMVVGGKVHEGGPGFLVSGPEGESLAVKNIGDEPVRGLAIFAPVFAPLESSDYLWPHDPHWPADQSASHGAT